MCLSGRGIFPFRSTTLPRCRDAFVSPADGVSPPKSLLLERKKVFPFLHRVPQFGTGINSRNLNSQLSAPSRRRAENWNPRLFTRGGGRFRRRFISAGQGNGSKVLSRRLQGLKRFVFQARGGDRGVTGGGTPSPIPLEPERARRSGRTENAAFPPPPLLFVSFFFFLNFLGAFSPFPVALHGEENRALPRRRKAPRQSVRSP